MFLSEPHFIVGSKDQWILTKPLVYHVESIYIPANIITVPVGFETDLASIPAFFRRIFPVNDTHRLPAVLHDYVYSLRGVLEKSKLTRLQCDRLFLEAMTVKKVPWWKRQAMYYAVRAGGFLYWNKQSMLDRGKSDGTTN